MSYLIKHALCCSHVVVVSARRRSTPLLSSTAVSIVCSSRHESDQHQTCKQ
jgi:hypothetical protein